MEDIEKHMAVHHSKLKSKIHQRILDLCWTLVDVNENIRESSAFNLITCLKSFDTTTDADNDLTYTLERLITGLSSFRKAARLGFYVALVEVLKTFNIIRAEDILSIIKSHLVITGTKQEKGGTVMGLCLAYGALIRSGKVYEKKKLLGEIVKELLNLIEEKEYVQVLVGTLIEQLFLNVKKSVFKKYIFPDLKEILEKGWDNCTPSRLWILLLCMKFFPNVISSDFLSSYWKEPVLICKNNFPEISKIVTQSTWNHPNVHPVCISLVETALGCDEFSNFWSSIVNDVLLQNQKEKIYLAFELVKEFLPKLKTSEQIKTVLSSQMMREFMHNLAHANLILHSASNLLAASLVSNLKDTEDPSLQITIVNQLITEPGSILFDRITNTKTVSSMLLHLKADAVKQLSRILMNYVIGKKIPDEIDSRDADNRRAYAAQMLTLLIKNVNVLKDFEWQTRILQFFCLHAFFNINRTDKVLLEGFKKPKEINGNLHAVLKERFFNLLDSVTSMTTIKWFPTVEDHFNMLYSVINFTNNLLSSPTIEPVQKFEEDELEAWNTMLKTVKKLHSRALKDGKDTGSHLFQILFLQMGLQLLANPKQSVKGLQELQICCSKALEQRSSTVKNINASYSEEAEPHWVEVIVDILISFLSQNRKLLRSVSKSIFILLQPHLTVSAVCQILHIIDPDKSTDEDSPLVSDEEYPDFNSSSSENESAESEDEEKDVNENLKTALRVAMNDDGNSSEKDVDEMDEQAMLRLDLALAEAFKNQGRKTKKDQAHDKELVMHFRIRCLDLIEIIIKVRPVLKILSVLLIPLVNALDFSIRSKDQQILFSRTQATLHHLLQIKRKEIQVDEFITEEEMQGYLEVLQQLFIKVQRVTNPQVAKTIADCCAFLVSGIRLLELKKKDSSIRKPKKAYKKLLNSVITLYRENMDKFFMLRNNLPPDLFISFMKKHPDLAWNFSDLLLNYAFKEEVRLFRKTQAFSMLNNSLTNQEVKQFITEDQWSDFCKIFQQHFTSAVNELAASESVKPLYATKLFQLFDIMVCYDDESFKKLEELPVVNVIQELFPKLVDRNVKKIARRILRRFNLDVPSVEIQNQKKQTDSRDTISVNSTEIFQESHSSVKKQSKRRTFSEWSQEDDDEERSTLDDELEEMDISDDEDLSVKKRKRECNSESSDISIDIDEIVKKERKLKKRK